MKTEIAAFGAGCFWGIELEFSNIPGVIATRVGYAGGNDKYKNPTYEEVCSEKTGHAEVVEITFDLQKTSYESLLDKFWKIHNPTTLNRQGLDYGPQYRSIIFYTNIKQKRKAIESMKEQQKKLQNKIVTKIQPLKKFYPAEEYHQKYLKKRDQKACNI